MVQTVVNLRGTIFDRQHDLGRQTWMCRHKTTRFALYAQGLIRVRCSAHLTVAMLLCKIIHEN